MTTPNLNVKSHKYLHQVKTLDDNVYNIKNAYTFCGNYNPIELTIDDVKCLLNGGALVDLSDGEYIHTFKLSNKALMFFNNH